jgi:hypothetical protein
MAFIEKAQPTVLSARLGTALKKHGAKISNYFETNKKYVII